MELGASRVGLGIARDIDTHLSDRVNPEFRVLEQRCCTSQHNGSELDKNNSFTASRRLDAPPIY